MIEEALIRLGVDTRPVAQHLRGIRGMIETWKADLKSINPMAVIGGGLTAAAGVVAKFGADAIAMAGQIKDTMDVTGQGAETLQAFALKVSESGGTMEDANKALIKFNQNMKESGKDPQKALLELMDKVKEAKDPVEQLTIASEAFGEKMAGKVVNALKAGSAAFEDFKKSASGRMLSDDDIRRLDDLSDSFAAFKQTWRARAGRLVAAATRPLTDSSSLQAIDEKFATAEAEKRAQSLKEAKAVSEALVKLQKAQRDLEFQGLPERMKAERIEKELLEIRRQYGAAVEGSADKINLKIKLLEKQKEFEDQSEKANKLDDEFRKKKIDQQEKLNEKRAQYNRMAAEQGGRVSDAMGAIGDQLNAGGRFTIEDLAQLNTRGGAQARQILWLRNAQKQMAMRWNFSGAQAAGNRADELMAAMSNSNPFLDDPMRKLVIEAAKQRQGMDELVSRAKGEGININPKMGE